MQVRMLRTIHNRKFSSDPIQAGTVITVPDQQAQQWMKTKPHPICERHVPGAPSNAALPGPDRNKDQGGEPRKDKDDPKKDDPKKEASGNGQTGSRAPKTGGSAKKSSASRRGRRSRKKT